MIIILENIGDICVCVSADFLHRNPFKNPDKKGSWKSTNSSRLNIFQNFQSSFYYCYNICKMNASLKPFYMQKIGDVLTNFLCCWCKKKFSTDVIWRLNSLEIKKRQFMINPLSKKPIWNLRPFSIFMHMFKASKVFFSIERARPKNNWWSVRWRVYFLWYLNQGLIPCWHRMSSWYKIQLSKKKKVWKIFL